MGAPLLSLVQSACAELGLTRPGVVAGATDQQTVQMFALINAVGADLLTKCQWTALQRLAVINVSASLSGTGNTTSGSAALSNILGADYFPLHPLFFSPFNRAVASTSSMCSTQMNSRLFRTFSGIST